VYLNHCLSLWNIVLALPEEFALLFFHQTVTFVVSRDSIHFLNSIFYCHQYFIQLDLDDPQSLPTSPLNWIFILFLTIYCELNVWILCACIRHICLTGTLMYQSVLFLSMDTFDILSRFLAIVNFVANSEPISMLLADANIVRYVCHWVDVMGS